PVPAPALPPPPVGSGPAAPRLGHSTPARRPYCGHASGPHLVQHHGLLHVCGAALLEAAPRTRRSTDAPTDIGLAARLCRPALLAPTQAVVSSAGPSALCDGPPCSCAGGVGVHSGWSGGLAVGPAGGLGRADPPSGDGAEASGVCRSRRREYDDR